MANRTMMAKALKLRKQNRALPRTLSLNRRGASGPDKAVLSEYKARAASLGYDEANTWWRGLDGEITNKAIANVPPGKVDIQQRSAEILRRFDDPLFVEHLSNPVRRVRIYFNSQGTEIIIQEMHYQQKVVRLSFCYSCIDDAYFALNNDLVPWRLQKEFPET